MTGESGPGIRGLSLTGLHLLLTYGCTYECDHCFVWSSPDQPGTLTLDQLDEILRQTRALESVEWFYFEGGEPFLYHALLRWGVRRAAAMGFRVGVVSNAYWAVDHRGALEWLRDIAGLVEDLSLSCDAYHGAEDHARRVDAARRAAGELGIPTDVIRIAPPASSEAQRRVGQLPAGESAIMFRGRAAERLVEGAPTDQWETFTACPHEDLRDPGRVHVDPLGYVHVCQGITIGNLFDAPLRELCAGYEPDSHPIVGPLLAAGPAELTRRYAVPRAVRYADACHLCYTARRSLRARFPAILAPDQMYGPAAAR